MMDSPSPPSSILVDLELPDPEPLPSRLIRVVSSLRVVLLGWFSVPEQTSPAQARDQFATEAEATLDEAARRFEEAGAEVTTRLVFTGNEFETISRISIEESCDAVLIPGTMAELRRVLVPLRGLPNAERIAPFVADLIHDETVDVTLLHVLEEGETETTSLETVLEPAAAMLNDHGLGAGGLELKTVTAKDPAAVIVERAGDYDLAVLGETKPTVREVLFGTVPEQIVKTADIPVIVVRNEDPSIASAEKASRAASS